MVKNWKKRWFVLQGDKIYYYVDELVCTKLFKINIRYCYSKCLNVLILCL